MIGGGRIILLSPYGFSVTDVLISTAPTLHSRVSYSTL